MSSQKQSHRLRKHEHYIKFRRMYIWASLEPSPLRLIAHYKWSKACPYPDMRRGRFR